MYNLPNPSPLARVLSGVSYKLLIPLSLINDFIMELLTEAPGSLSEMHQQDLRTMVTGASQLYEELNGLITHARCEIEEIIACDSYEQPVANRLLDMSHELHTPLNPIVGYAQVLLMDEALNAAQRRRIEAIHHNSSGILALIGDLMDQARREVGRPINDAPLIDLAAVLRQVVKECGGLIAERPITMQAVLDEDLPPLYGDRDRLRQILSILLNNAITLTPAGNILIEVDAEQNPQTGRHRIRISVADAGPGIAPEHLPYVFEPVYEGNARTTQEVRLIGMGMAYVRPLVELQGGQIFVESNPGAGSVFTVTLPASQGGGDSLP